MPKIAFTGGGSMGHVTPVLALVPGLAGMGYEIIFIGSKNENEKKVVSDSGIVFYSIRAGKLRRYFDLKNIKDFVNIFFGFSDALKILRKEKPDIVFSKGGYISTPVVFAAYILKIPVILHESDITPGLANRLSAPFAKTICCSFDATAGYFNKKKTIMTGIPIRKELFEGDMQKGLLLCGFTRQKPVLLVMGGSQGSRMINDSIYGVLDALLEKFQVCHLVGKDGIRKEFESLCGYKAFTYVDKDMKDIMAAADIILSRAGATSIFEYLALRKPNLLIPLSVKKSRGDQVKNAEEFLKKGYSRVIPEEELCADRLMDAITEIYMDRKSIMACMSVDNRPDSNNILIGLIEKTIKDGVK
jgi:UDP-N-acetylglucosamine--N-acetylmuramyl-(pentapeptide) pyrophosphoryl-undecaprenol N-acetylglucosamine transferase